MSPLGKVSPNIFNTSERTPGNADAKDPKARARLYNAATQVVTVVAARVRGQAIGEGPRGYTD